MNNTTELMSKLLKQFHKTRSTKNLHIEITVDDYLLIMEGLNNLKVKTILEEKW